MINTDMSGRALDFTLGEIYKAEDEQYNGKIICIEDGKLGFEDPELYLQITALV